MTRGQVEPKKNVTLHVFCAVKGHISVAVVLFAQSITETVVAFQAGT